MIATLRQRNFALLWSAGLISLIGDWGFYAAMPIFILDETGSVFLAGLVWAVIMLPNIVIGPIAGVFVDRYDRKRIMFWGNLLQTGVASLLLLGGSNLGVGLAMAVLLLQACLYAVYSPAESALLPTLVEERYLAQANSLNSLNDNIARVAGPLVGALLYAWLGIRGIALGNMISFAGSAILVSMVVTSAARPVAADTSHAEPVIRALMHGARTVWRDRMLRTLFLVISLAALADGPLTAMLAPFVRETLDRSAADFGAFLSFRGVAGIVGGVLVAHVAGRLRDEHMLPACLLLVGGEIAAIALIQNYVVAIILMVLSGPAIIGMNVTITTLLQRFSEDAVRGRLFSLVAAFWSIVFLISTVLGSASAAILSPAAILFGSGLLYALAGAVTLFVLPAAMRAQRLSAQPDDVPIAQSEQPA